MCALMIVKWLKPPSTGFRNRARATRPASAHSESFGAGTYKGVQTMSFLLEGVRVEQEGTPRQHGTCVEDLGSWRTQRPLERK